MDTNKNEAAEKYRLKQAAQVLTACGYIPASDGSGGWIQSKNER